ncbi:MAG: hypothetical protein ACYTFT_02855, partial [Planctomycetota bacterium]
MPPTFRFRAFSLPVLAMGALLTTALLAPPAPAQDRPAAGVPQDILALEADLEAAANTIRPSTVLIAATSPTG